MIVEVVVAGLCLQGEAGADHVPLESLEDAVCNVRVPLKVSGAGAEGVPAVTVCDVGGLVGRPPVLIQPATVCGVIA